MRFVVDSAPAAPGAEPVPLDPKELAAETALIGALPAVAAGGVRFDNRILISLRRIIHGFDLYSKRLLATSHITGPQLVCLLAMVEAGPLTCAALGRRVSLSASTIVGILDRLEEKGLVTRTRAHDDRRVVRVAATPEGERLARHAPSPLQETLSQRLAALPELEQATIALSLERVVELMNAHGATAVRRPGVDPDGAPTP